MKKTFTKEEKKEYFKSLREQWQASKKLADNDETAKALHREAGSNYSYYSFYFTLLAMREQNLEGIPYVDCKTFNKWKEAGFKVIKGEKSKVKGLTWIHPVNKEGEELEDMIYPKTYHLFHKTQVEELVK